MRSRLALLTSLVLLAERAISVPLADPSPVTSAAASAVSASLGGLTFVNKASIWLVIQIQFLLYF